MSKRPFKMLIIDDDEDLRHQFSEYFKDFDFEVTVASDGREGEQIFREILPDVTLLDIYMPHQEGIETLINLRKDFPDRIIVVMSGGFTIIETRKSGDGTEVLDSIRHFQPTERLRKPINLEDLRTKLEELLTENQ